MDIREALTAAMDKQETVTETPITTAEPVTEVVTETTEQKADRLRDEGGRFAKNSTPEGNGPGQNAIAAAPDSPAVEPRKPPSSWKKEYWEQYQKLDPKVADYINQREQEFAQGVSTYRDEALKAKDIHEAMAPFMDDLNRYNIAPKQWISQLGAAHQMLAKGTAEQKVQMFRKLANDYGVNFQAIQTGQVDPLTEYLGPLQQQIAELKGQFGSMQEQGQQAEQRVLAQELQQFASTHEHYESVKAQMAGLLQANLAQDLQGAYDKALRLHDDLWQAEQQRQAEAKRQDEADRVKKARANNVSVKGSTPASMTGEGKKGLRETLSEAYDAHAGGRV